MSPRSFVYTIPVAAHMTRGRARRQLATAKADRLRASLPAGDPDEVAVDVDAAADRLGLQVVVRRMDPGVLGMLVGEAGVFVGVVSAGIGGARETRLEVARLCGRRVLHPAADDVYVDDMRLPRDPRRVEINVFAAALLLPEADVRRELVAPSWVPDRASARIAARFGVPRSFALVRLVKLGLLPGWQSDRW
jgi:hypothetical protein